MSVIERALEKARSGGEHPPPQAQPERRGAGLASAHGATEPPPAVAALVRPLVPRIADAPQLTISESVLQDVGLRAPAEQLHQQSAEYRHIKRQILTQMAVGSAGKSRMVLVASALPGEGKTFTAANLALSLALEPDYSVLLVDADIIKPNLTRLFGLTDHVGLMDAAANPEVSVESTIITTNVAGLSILPAGRPNANATEYFASLRMQQILNQLLEAPNRIIVIDSLPLLLTTEARALLPLAGQVLLVVRAETTPRHAVLQALELMPDDTNAKLLLNVVEHSVLSDYYGYGHGYRYNYAQSDAKPGGVGA